MSAKSQERADRPKGRNNQSLYAVVLNLAILPEDVHPEAPRFLRRCESLP